MNLSMKRRQHLAFLLLLTAATLLAVLGYHSFREDRVLLRKGERLLAVNDFQGAVPLCRESLRLGNSSPRLLKSLGDACLGSGRFREAAEAYQAFLRQVPDNLPVRSSLARAISLGGRPEQLEREESQSPGVKP